MGIWDDPLANPMESFLRSHQRLKQIPTRQPPWTTPYYINTKTVFNSASSPLSSLAKLVHQRTYTKEPETMDFNKEYLDVVLVPTGLLIMLIYHLFLLYKYFHQPLSTSMGYENNDKRNWVAGILQVHNYLLYIYFFRIRVHDEHVDEI